MRMITITPASMRPRSRDRGIEAASQVLCARLAGFNEAPIKRPGNWENIARYTLFLEALQ